MITGDEVSIFPDQTKFLQKLKELGRTKDILAIPGTTVEITPQSISVSQPEGTNFAEIFDQKKNICANTNLIGPHGSKTKSKSGSRRLAT